MSWTEKERLAMRRKDVMMRFGVCDFLIDHPSPGTTPFERAARYRMSRQSLLAKLQQLDEHDIAEAQQRIFAGAEGGLR